MTSFCGPGADQIGLSAVKGKKRMWSCGGEPVVLANYRFGSTVGSGSSCVQYDHFRVFANGLE